MHINDLSHQTAREVVPGYRARFVHSDRVTLAYWDIEAGAALPEHAHPHEQLTNVISGKFQLTIAGETHLLEPGLVAEIPPNVLHSGVAQTACRLIDVFCPVREDYR
jgi:quercetin dioxygenase-like cupin family protein